MYVLKPVEDADYINLLKLPAFIVPDGNLDKSVNAVVGNVALNTPRRLNDSISHANFNTSVSSPSTSILASSILKRKASTPHPHATIKSPNNRKSLHINPNFYESEEANVSASESKARTLASSLKYSKAVVTNSGSKSVKFKLIKYTREITDQDNVVDDEVEELEPEEDNDASPDKLVEKTKNIANEANGSPCASKQSPEKHSAERKKLTFAEDDENEPLVFNQSNCQEKSVTEKVADEEDDGDVSMQFDL
jgi:hypothetical protein